MHPSQIISPMARKSRWRGWLVHVRGTLRLALFGSALFGSHPSLFAQSFVSEWAEADIGRIGPTGMALDTIAGVTYLYVSDQNHGRILTFTTATGGRVAVWRT